VSSTNIAERARRILGNPRGEWVKIAAEPATVQSLYTNWIMVLAAIGPIALLLSMHPLQVAVAQYVRSLITTFVLALVVDALAPSFGGTKDFTASLKLTAYSYTAAWLAGVFNLLGTLGDIVILIATLYTLYTFLVGAPLLNRSSPDKAVPFTLVVVLCAVVLFFLARFAFTGMLAPPMHAGMGVVFRCQDSVAVALKCATFPDLRTTRAFRHAPTRTDGHAASGAAHAGIARAPSARADRPRA
jgi:hypothetical protein